MPSCRCESAERTAVSEPIELQNNVPLLERWLAGFFVLAATPLIYLGYAQSDELPDWIVPIIRVGFPLFLIAMLWYAFVQRRRVHVVLTPGSSIARIEERRLWARSITESVVLSAELEIGEDIDGDPCGKLVLRLPSDELITVAEGGERGVARLGVGARALLDRHGSDVLKYPIRDAWWGVRSGSSAADHQDGDIVACIRRMREDCVSDVVLVARNGCEHRAQAVE